MDDQDLCRVCGFPPSGHARQYNCTEPHPSNVEATCTGCGATFVTADPIDDAARCRDCVIRRATASQSEGGEA